MYNFIISQKDLPNEITINTVQKVSLESYPRYLLKRSGDELLTKPREETNNYCLLRQLSLFRFCPATN